MKITKTLTLMCAAVSVLACAVPAHAQSRGNRGGGGHRGGGMQAGNSHRGDGNRGGHFRHNRGGSRVNFYFGGGFGSPFYGYGYYPYYGYPGYGYRGYGYPYGYGAPVGAYYTYDPRGIYQGRVVNSRRGTNDGGGKDVSMAARVQRQLADAGYYRGEIDGIVGDGTRQAIRNYERANGLRVDGRIDDELLSTLGLG